MQTTDLILPLIALIVGAFGAWLAAISGHRFALIDSPNERSSHSEPTPKGGGIGLLAAFIIASLWLEVQPGFWISIAILALLSLFVDRFHFSPKLRLAFQFSAALVVLVGTFQPGSLGFGVQFLWRGSGEVRLRRMETGRRPALGRHRLPGQPEVVGTGLETIPGSGEYADGLWAHRLPWLRAVRPGLRQRRGLGNHRAPS